MKHLKLLTPSLMFLYLATLSTTAMADHSDPILGFGFAVVMLVVPLWYTLGKLIGTVKGGKIDTWLLLSRFTVWVALIVLLVGLIGDYWPADYSLGLWLFILIASLWGTGLNIAVKESIDEGEEMRQRQRS